MRRELRRLQELYSLGGLSEIGRGACSWLLTSPIVKQIREKITWALGGDSVWERDWDILCVLDGCRVDLFREVVGNTDVMTSVGATSRTWVDRTFEACESPENIGYITGNPFWTRIASDELGYFHVQSPENTEYGVETVSPTVLSEHAINIWRRRESLGLNKLIVHFMQPHAPFRSEPAWFERTIGEDSWSANIWKRLRDGEFTEQEVWKAYADNLRWVMEDGVTPLQSNCDGTIALNADHGNAMGEWGFYGHPLGCPIDAVREVPWKIVEGTDEKTVLPDTKTATDSVNVEEHLVALGYK